jgi:hypothetical protein
MIRSPRLALALCAAAAAALTGCVDYEVVRKKEIDSWKQPSREGGVDVLWVIDGSYSMDEEQLQLAAHADTFVTFLSTAPVDFHLAVTTTDADGAGTLIGPVLDLETPELSDAFLAQVVTVGEGDRTEEGFTAALAAGGLETGGADFVREAADLEIVFFSDEDDQSSVEPADFIAELKDGRPRGGLSINAIAGDLPDGCASISAAADPTPRYVEAVEATGGLRESICSYDYKAMMERMALHVLGLQVRFTLTRLPELATMEVRVDGALVHQRDRHGWRYDAGDNSVVFDGFSVPPPGAGIEVHYYEWNGNSAQTLDTGEAR